MPDPAALPALSGAVATGAAYLLGMLPTARVVAGRVGVDPTSAGSGNPGASNVTRLVGWRAGVAVLAGDLAKGAAATAAGLLIGGRPLALVGALAVVLGHVVPLTRPTRGGKGVATAAGAALVLWPGALLTVAVAWTAVLLVSRRAAVASLAAAAVLPAAVLVAGAGPADVLVALALGVLVAVRHRDNLRRLRRGEEPRLRRAARAGPLPCSMPGER